MPNTVNVALSIPNTGDFVGAWGTAAVNPNMQVVDGLLGGSQSISLAGSMLTTLGISSGVIGTGSITPGAGPVQSANRFIEFTGVLTANCVVTFPRPGEWIILNSCTGNFTVTARATGTGNVIGLPPGEEVSAFNNGTNFRFANLGRVGSYIDLAVTTTPAWISACTVPPYLPCVGTATYSATVYPALAAMLGSTWGGNGITTFGVPDLGNRVRVSLGTRITTALGGLDGSTLGAAGGTAASAISASQLPEHTHSVTDPGHSHGVSGASGVDAAGARPLSSANAVGGSNNSPSGFVSSNGGGLLIQTKTAGISLGTSGGTAAFPVIQPTMIAGITFIRAG